LAIISEEQEMVARAIPGKPWKVRTAVIMFWLSLGIALIGLITRSITVFSTVTTAETIMSALVVLAVYFGLIVMIGKGKNWARIVFLVLSIFDVPFAIWAIIQTLSHLAFSGPAGVVTIILKVAELALRIMALALLFQRDSSDWFKAMKNVRHAIPTMKGLDIETSGNTDAWSPDGTDYKITYMQLWAPKYGFIQGGTIGTDSETVRLTGLRAGGILFHLLCPACIIALNDICGVKFGYRLNFYLMFGLIAAILLLANYRWKLLERSSVFVKKTLVTSVARNRRKISFCLPDPSGIGGRSVKVSVRAKNKEQAIRLENELRS
jgi:hypothetical protein